MSMHLFSSLFQVVKLSNIVKNASGKIWKINKISGIPHLDG